MNPKPCPICGAHLLATVGGDGQPVGFSHPNPSKGQPMCKMSGSHIGAAYVITAQATANAESVRLLAEAQAEVTRMAGIARGDAIEAIRTAIAQDQTFVEYQRIRDWDGTLPVTVMGEQPEMLMQFPSTQN